MSLVHWNWLVWAELLAIELPLAIVAFLALADITYITSTAALVWRGVAFGVNLLAWFVLVYFVDPATSGRAGTARTRGTAPARVHNGYFIVPTLAHLVLLAHWIAFRSKFAGLSPLTFFVNVDAFAVFRSIELLGELAFALILVYWLVESRTTRTNVRVTEWELANKVRSQTASSGAI